MSSIKQHGQHFINAFGYSAKGLKAAWENEKAFRQEVILAIVLIPLAFIIGSSFAQKAFLISSVLLVLLTELVNSAIEAVVDRFGGEHHALSGRAKDLGSAAVMLALINAAFVWLLAVFYLIF